MSSDDIAQCVGSLLHCVHADNKVGSDNALLQYCGLRVLEGVLSGDMSANDYNAACWAIRERIAQPAIRFVKLDPINHPPRRTPGIDSILVIPNNTNLDSQSTLTKQAKLIGSPIDAAATSELGTVVRSTVLNSDYYSEVWHLVCRNPSDPSLQSFSECIQSLVADGGVRFFRLPVFGGDEDWSKWADGLCRWLFMRENIQNASAFIDVCFIDESSHEAERIATELRCSGVPHYWPSNE